MTLNEFADYVVKGNKDVNRFYLMVAIEDICTSEVFNNLKVMNPKDLNEDLVSINLTDWHTPMDPYAERLLIANVDFLIRKANNLETKFSKEGQEVKEEPLTNFKIY